MTHVDPDLDELRRAAERARRAATDLLDAGGLVGTSELAKRWGVAYATAAGHTRHPEFPAPITRIGRADVWLTAETDLYRHTPRRPGPKGSSRS